MRSLVYQLVIPLTVISFATISQSWYVLPVDGVDTVMYGFPLPYSCEGWHTSLSTQYFAFEFLIDFAAYFSFWFLLTFLIHQFIVPIRIHKTLGIVLMVIALLIGHLSIIVVRLPENVHYFKRDFEMEVLDTRWEFILGDNPRYLYRDYVPEE